MMTLLDTHTLLWFAQNDPQLPRRLVEFISTRDDCHISRGSLWEVAIKFSSGKLKLHMTYSQWLRLVQAQGFCLLEITDAHLRTLTGLPHHHRDPFDRLLIAQALTDDLTLLSRDAKFADYPVRVEW